MVTGLNKAAEEGVWVQGSGIVIPCMYMLYGNKVNRADIRDKLKKKRQMEDTGSEPVKNCEKLLTFECTSMITAGFSPGFSSRVAFFNIHKFNDIHNFNNIHVWILCKRSCTCVNAV